MITAHRAGGSLTFLNKAGKPIGTILISDLGALVAAGDRVPVLVNGGPVGSVWRTQKTCVVSLTDGPAFSCPWHELRSCALCVGTSVLFTRIEKGVNTPPSTVRTSIPDSHPIQSKTPETSPGRVTRSVNHSTPVKALAPGPVKEHVIIPPKRWNPKKSGYTKHAPRKVPAGGIA